MFKPRMYSILAFTVIFFAMLVGCADENTSLSEEKDFAETDTVKTVKKNELMTEQIGTEAEAEEKTLATEETKSSEETSDTPANTIPAIVTDVVDGDTFEATIDGKKEKVRLILVDTPETVHPSKPVEPFGPEASQFAKDTLKGKEVHLELDVSERDRYGRILAYVWVGDKMFNEMLLEKGLARVSVFPPNVKYVDRFREIEKEAQRKGVGIWSVENYAIEEQKTNEPNTVKNTDGNCEEPKIKGNINSKGEKIYHVPGGQFYDVTDPEEIFCTEEEAIEAGYRKSKR